tara:strand:- start:429 stop:623 length:195 start_codon:yes stop_codon:yes gene_type:complete
LIKKGIAGVGQIPRFINFLPLAFIPFATAWSRISPLILVSLPSNIGSFFSKVRPRAYPTLYAKE